MRLDLYLCENGYAASRQRARSLIDAGQVYIDGVQRTKASFSVPDGTAVSVEIRGEIMPYVGRGGYKMAGVYNNGKVEQGMAGGVCQVTTTLYNAAIMAELEIVERHPHSMTVGYVPLGRDAAVAGTYKDLKFRNNTEYPIMIEAYAANGKLVMNIFGHEVHNAGRKVSFDTVYEATVPKPAEKITEDPNRPEGEREITSKGRTGSKVSVYKTVTDGGKTKREWFSSSSYRAVADEVTVGTKKVEAPVVAPVDPFAGVTVVPAPDVTTDVPVDDGFGIN